MRLFYYLIKLHVFVFFICLKFIEIFLTAGVLAGPSLKSYSIQDKAGVESMCCFCVQQGPTLVNRVLLDWLGFLQYLFFHISW